MRRASLSISTNAIVVLIVAVIMLGLIIGLVTRGFQAAEDQFFANIDQVPEPDRPTTTDQIKVSPAVIRAGAGETVVMKVRFRNGGTRISNAVEPHFDSCLPSNVIDGSGDSFVSFPKDSFEPNEEHTYQLQFNILAAVDKGTYQCQITVDDIKEVFEVVIR